MEFLKNLGAVAFLLAFAWAIGSFLMERFPRRASDDEDRHSGDW